MTNADPTVDRHPWNTQFTWVDRTGPFQVLTDEQAAQFDRDGYVVLDDVFPVSTIEAVRAEVDAFEAELDAMLRAVDGGRVSIAESGAITFTTHLVTRAIGVRKRVAGDASLGGSSGRARPDGGRSSSCWQTAQSWWTDEQGRRGSAPPSSCRRSPGTGTPARCCAPRSEAR